MRINLAAFDTEKCSLAELNSAFCESANLRRGSLDGFLKKLNVLVSELPRLRFGFTAKELDEYLLKSRGVAQRGI